MVITVQVINIRCECGGAYINSRSSYMIDEQDTTVTCEECGKVISVPDGIFKVIKTARTKKQ